MWPEKGLNILAMVVEEDEEQFEEYSFCVAIEISLDVSWFVVRKDEENFMKGNYL